MDILYFLVHWHAAEVCDIQKKRKFCAFDVTFLLDPLVPFLPRRIDEEHVQFSIHFI